MIVEPDFLDHWKTRMLVGLLNDEAAPLYVLRLWAHCQSRKQDQFTNLPPEALKALCRFPGQANQLESSLSASGFIRRGVDGSLVAVNWATVNASLIASWGNGRKGGRPPKPKGNPEETQGICLGSENETQEKPTSSSLLLPPSSFDSSSDREKFLRGLDNALPPDMNVPPMREALWEWRLWIRKVKCKDFDPIAAKSLCSSLGSAGWPVEKIVRGLNKSRGNLWHNVKDPDEGSPRSGNGHPKPEATKPIDGI